jgi:hypothetical protein
VLAGPGRAEFEAHTGRRLRAGCQGDRAEWWSSEKR